MPVEKECPGDYGINDAPLLGDVVISLEIVFKGKKQRLTTTRGIL